MENSSTQDSIPQFSPVVLNFNTRGIENAGKSTTFSKKDVEAARLEYNHSKNYILCKLDGRVVRKDKETGLVFKGSISKEQFFAIVKLHNSQSGDNLDPQEEFDDLQEIKDIERD